MRAIERVGVDTDVVVCIGDIGQERTKFVFIGVVDFAIDTIHFFFDFLTNDTNFVVGKKFFSTFLQSESIVQIRKKISPKGFDWIYLLINLS